MGDTPRAEDVRPGQIIAYTPTNAAEGADPVALYVTVTQREAPNRVLILGGHFPSGVFVRVHRAVLPARHPVTIMGSRWVTTPGAALLHVQGEGETATVCEQTSDRDVDLTGDDPSRVFALTPVCRTCAYRAVRQAQETERYDPAPFFYDLP